MPGLVLKSLGWGKYRSAVPETYFFIEDFKDMDMSLPNPGQLTQQTAQLHANLSPNGMFGFEVTTFAGDVPHAKAGSPTGPSSSLESLVCVSKPTRKPTGVGTSSS